MTDLEEVMWQAWKKMAPILKANPHELKARLARRRSTMFLRPPRAWCLAVRASDYRIEPYRGAAMVPEDAMDKTSEWHPGRVVRHQVYLTKSSIQRICAPVDAQPDGIPTYELAKMLGCSTRDLRTFRRQPGVREDRLKNFLGRRGIGTAFLYFDRPLDPAMFAKRPPDPIWGCLWQLHAQSLPDDFEVQLTRVPVYVPNPRAKSIMDSLDSEASPSCPRASVPLCLSPLTTNNGQLTTDPTTDHGPLTTDKTEFRGWRWLCPGCKKNASILFYPLPTPDWAQYVGFKIGHDPLDARPAPNQCFACWRCHRMIYFSPQQLAKSWNHLILHYSGGLLFGQEVPLPDSLRPRRLRAFHRPKPRPSPRRDELARLLAHTTLTPAQIALEMNLSPATIGFNIWLTYKHYHVKTRAQLRALLAQPLKLAAG